MIEKVYICQQVLKNKSTIRECERISYSNTFKKVYSILFDWLLSMSFVHENNLKSNNFVIARVIGILLSTSMCLNVP